MSYKKTAAQLLFKQMLQKKLSFHSALAMFRPINAFSARGRSDASRKNLKVSMRHLLEATKRGGLAAWTSVLFPAEILVPFGIRAIPLEVMASFFSSVGLANHMLGIAESRDVPLTMCSFHRFLLGFSATGVFEKPKIVAATSLMCDGNIKSFANVAAEQGVPFIFLDIPHEENDEAISYVRDQLQKILENLCVFTGRRSHDLNLGNIADCANASFDLMKEIYNLRISCRKNVFRGFEFANFVFPFLFQLGRQELIGVLEQHKKDLVEGKSRHKYYKNAPDRGKSCKRLMWLHIAPQYKTDIWDIIDDGIHSKVVCDEYSTLHFERYDKADPLGSIAKRLISHPNNGPLGRRLDHILKVARDFKVDGIIQYSSWGCHQSSGNVSLLGHEIENAGFKFININSDALNVDNSSNEQERTRLEAFLENM